VDSLKARHKKMTNGGDLVHDPERKTFGSADLGGGLTKREYFAALAMQGFLAHGINSDAALTLGRVAVDTADHLIDALNKEAK
jgi:hypothetical protein